MIKAIFFDCFEVLYQAPPFGYIPDADDKVVSGMVLNRELLSFSQGLRKQYKVGVISNSSPGLFNEFFGPEDRNKFFDAAIISSEVGVSKPQPEIFRLACRQVGVTPDEALFIDDVARYCDAAAEVGMYAIIYESNEQAIGQINKLLASK